MQRALATTTTVVVLTALAVSTAGCGRSPATGAPPAAHTAASDRPSAVTAAQATEAEVYVQVLRRFLTTPADNTFPGPGFKTVYVLDHAYANAANSVGTRRRGVPIASQVQSQVTAALAGLAHVIFIADQRSVLVDRNTKLNCAHVRNGGFLITLGPLFGYGRQLLVAISGTVGCSGGAGITYVLQDQPHAGWQVTGTHLPPLAMS